MNLGFFHIGDCFSLIRTPPYVGRSTAVQAAIFTHSFR